MKEKFRDIIGYEGIYQVSDIGSIKKLKGFMNPNERVARQHINSNGYYVVGLTKNGKETKKRVHILVAEAFLNHNPNNNFNLIIDHKNNIKTDNKLNNLQIISQRENSSKDKWRYNKTSNNVGVYLNKQSGKWYSGIQLGKTTHFLGSFNNQHDAKMEYRKALEYLKRNISLDNYPFEKAPKKHEVFLTELCQEYLRSAV